MIGLLFLLVAAAFILGVPIFIGLAGAVTVVFAASGSIDLAVVTQRMVAGIDKFSLMSVPLFIYAANLMGRGGISQRIVNLANVFVGRVSGGLGISAIVACLFFGAISGSAPATVVAIGSILYPVLVKKKYPDSFIAGVLTSSGALGLIIPPSMTMIVYGSVTGASVGELFMSGFGAGLVFAAMFVIYTFVYALHHKEIVREPKTGLKEKFMAIGDSLWGLGVPIIIIGGIYGGVFTPTEAAAVAVVYALVVSLFVYRELDLKGVFECALDSGITTVQIMILLAAASIFAWILTTQGVTQSLASSILAVSNNKYVILILINILLLVAGMFLDGSSIITILAPLLIPITRSIGIDDIHLGIIMVVNTAIGMFTPPFGLNLFVGSSVLGMPVMKVARGAVPFIILAVVALLIVTYIPGVAMFIPNLVYGK